VEAPATVDVFTPFTLAMFIILSLANLL
jgi:hypothetical protein